MVLRRLLVSLALVASLGIPAAGAEAPLVLGVGIRSAADISVAQSLAGPAPFAARVSIAWADPGALDQKFASVLQAAAQGWKTVVNLRYQPPEGIPVAGRPAAFAGWAATIAERLRGTPGVSFELTNRPNAFVPDPGSDAGRAGVMEALILGLQATSAAGGGAPVGFSFLATGTPADHAWWTQLAAEGGPSLAFAVDFVGVQLYPGTLVPGLPWSAGGPRRWTRTALTDLREVLMPIAGLGFDVPIRVGEFGFWVFERGVPAFGGDEDLDTVLRTETAQARVLDAIAGGIADVSVSSGVREAVWWSATDAGCALALCGGLVAEGGRERPSFDAFCTQVSRLHGVFPPCIGVTN